MLPTLLSFAAIVSAAPDTSRAQLNVFGSFGYVALSLPQLVVGGLSPAPAAPDAHSLLGEGGLALTLFPRRPLVDTEAPLSLQPFLERLTTLRFAVSGGGFDTRETGFGLPGVVERTEQHAAVSAAADVYVTRHFIVGGLFGLSWSTITDTTSLSRPETRATFALPLSLTVGGRFYDTRVNAFWSVRPTDAGGAWQVPFWGGAGVEVQSVFQNRLNVYCNIHAIDQGAFATLAVAVYPFRRFGFYGSLFGGGGRLYVTVNGQSQERFGGALGLELWASRHFGGSFTYAPTWTSGPTPSLEHLFTLAFSSRVL